MMAARDIFKVVSDFSEEQSIKWKNSFAVCTDGAPAMLGCRFEFQALIRAVGPNANSTHCLIQKKVLAVKTSVRFGINHVS
jgi:hypothetical protein